MKQFSLILCLLLKTFFINAQTTGIVIDKENNPLKDVSVYLADYKILLSTNLEGEFTINQKITRSTSIHFSKSGYLSKLVKYKDSEDLKIVLEDLHISLDEVGVVETYNELGNARLTNIENKKIDFMNSNSMVENIAQLSGVDVISSGMGIQKVVVRGLSGMRVVTYLNGMKIENQQWANDHGIGFTDLGLGEVELIKGSSALKYGGEAIGGVLYFKDSPFTTDKRMKGFIATKLNNSSYLSSSQFGVKWNKNNLYFNIHGQYSISSDYRLPNSRYLYNSRFRQDAIKFSLAHRYKNWQNIFRYQVHTEAVGIPAHAHVFNPRYIDLTDISYSSKDLSAESYEVRRPNQFIHNQLFIYESNYLIDKYKFSLHAAHFINRLEEWEAVTRPAFDLTLSNTQLMPNIRYQSKDFAINLGSQISMLTNKNNISYRLVPDASSFNLGTYAIIDYEKGDIGFNAGLRHDYKELESTDASLNGDYNNQFTTTTYSTGLYYNLSDHIVRFTFSSAFRAPHFSELFSDGVHHGTNRYEIGSRNLSVEKGDQFDLKYQWSNDHLGIIINPFIQYITDFISINPTDSMKNNYRVYEYTQFDEVELKGIEMNLHYHPHILHSLHLEQSYSFLKAENKNSDYGLALTPANSIRTKILFDFSDYSKFVKYKLNYLAILHVHKYAQERFAEFEDLTESYDVFSAQLGLNVIKRLNCTMAVNNILNKDYSPHTSRVRGVTEFGVPDPGRFFSINVKYEF